MKCTREECSCCAYKRWDVNKCKYENCTYRMCARCVFLYGRSQCPACTRDHAFTLQKKCICYFPKAGRMCTFVIHSPHVDCICSFVVFPCFALFGIAILGNMILFMISPNSMMYTNFAQFILQGLLVMVPIILVFMCCCNCGEGSDE